MQQNHDMQEPATAGICGDGVPRNGIDRQTSQREHMRAMTTARQTAERRHSQSHPIERNLDRMARQTAVANRNAALHEELARIDAEHHRWMIEHGMDETASMQKVRVIKTGPNSSGAKCSTESE